MPRKPNAKDVAREAGVSTATVDRVLNSRGGVAAEKEARVLEAARRLKLDRMLDQRPARTIRIAVLLQPPANPFHAELQAGFQAARRMHAGLNMEFRIHHLVPTEPAKVAAQIDSLGGSHDGFVVCALHDPAIAAALDRQIARGRAVLTIGTDIRTEGERVYVGPDNIRSGRVAGDLMGRLIGPPGGAVLVIAGLLSMIGHEQREQGFRAVLAERHPACSVAAVVESREDSGRAGELVFRALRDRPDLRGIYNASAGSREVADAIRAAGRARDLVVITHELTEDRRKLLREGLIDAVIDQNPALEVRMAVEVLAARFGRLDKGPATTLTPVQIHMVETC
ncbi:LacI family DNA-binding transcriptional regulator [Poseidonocella sp. HB161398]|uniref:LacI family DNA-binding transcriptional regulator n=1 Tax=Poseidonocella sp. HB161398 TaxID=2320855 RepID=UPI0011087D3D|nr:LacI family DNA-binding transcriptional regulator [Poseidonocella sp. HB161398]